MNDFFLADDLSGALDAAAAFHHCGRRVRILAKPGAWDEAASDEIIAMTTETRNVRAEVAADTVGRLLAVARSRGGRLLYKKIDSTLRGPVAAELLALMNALPDSRILFAPANPRVGRIVRAGLLLVNGVPVADTEFGRDPASPLRTSNIRELLGCAASDRVIIPDIESESDLEQAVLAVEADAKPWVGVGSGGLVHAVAARSLMRGSRVAGPGAPLPASPTLMIGGSAHPLNREQARHVAATCGIHVHELRVPAGPDNLKAAAADLRMHGCAVVHLPPERCDHAEALRAVVETAAELVRSCGVRRVFVTGGETAFALCERLRVATLDYAAEIEPGMALARAGSPAGPMLFAVKPGGFGDAQSWTRAYQALRNA